MDKNTPNKGKVLFDISMSLDGYITAANVRPEEPMGDGGQVLHGWAFNSKDPRNQELLAQGGNMGVVIAGRNTYELSVPWWQADGPAGPARIPVVVVSRDVPKDVPEDSVYHFADSIEVALKKARELANGKDVGVMGGANIAQQFIKAGLLDEISIHLVPILFGKGIRLFDHIGTEHIELETPVVTETPEATHLRYVVKKSHEPGRENAK